MDVVYKFSYATFDKDAHQDRFMNSCRFVPNLLRYTCTKNYFNAKSFGKVIAKTKACSFFATQCSSKNTIIIRRKILVAGSGTDCIHIEHFIPNNSVTCHCMNSISRNQNIKFYFISVAIRNHDDDICSPDFFRQNCSDKIL